jgi:hypothetical protein
MTTIVGSGSESVSRDMDPRIQIRIGIHTKMPWIRKTDLIYLDIKGNSKLIPKLVKSNISCIAWNSHILNLVRHSL